MKNPLLTDEKIAQARTIIDTMQAEMKHYIIGQEEFIHKILYTVFANGHMLVEGLPGLAKTRALKYFSRIIKDMGYKRIQFTPDLLPSDITGTLILNPKDGTFSTQKGPIFTNFVLADEINRAPAKVQSALLEAMQEYQVTIGTETHILPVPFFVLATQNPIEQEGTYPLPEAQVDRFLLKTVVTYPKTDEELAILNLLENKDAEKEPETVCTKDDILAIQKHAEHIYLDNRLKEYIVKIVDATRRPESYGLKDVASHIQAGASPRASIAFMRVSKVVALMQGRNYVEPEDIKAIQYDVLRHRILLTYEAEAERITTESIIDRIFQAVQVP